MPLPRLLLLAAALGACYPDPVRVPFDPPAFRIADSAYWAGTTITVLSEIRTYGTATLRIASREVQMVRVNDTTLTGQLPTDVWGIELAPILEYQRWEVELPPVRFYGPTWQSYNPTVLLPSSDGLATWRPNHQTLVLYPTAEGLAVNHAASSGWFLWGLTSHGLSAPGPTYDPDAWIFRRHSIAPLERWNLYPPYSMRLIDTVPDIGRPTVDTYALLSRDAAVAFVGDSGWLVRRNGTGGLDTSATFRLEGRKRVVFSPGGDRALLVSGAGEIRSPSPIGGLPMFNLPDGGIAWITTELRTITAAAFTLTGDTVVVAGNRFGGTDARTLYFLSADDGTVLGSMELGDPIRAIVVDRDRPYVHVLTRTDAPRHEVRVFHTDGFSLVGHMSGRCLLECPSGLTMIADRVEGVVVIEQAPGVEGIVSWAYSLPPVE